MKIVLIDYGAGNVQSVKYALNRLGIEPSLTKDHDEIKSADKVIFPGVGSAKAAMEQLKASGLDALIPTLTIQDATSFSDEIMFNAYSQNSSLREPVQKPYSVLLTAQWSLR